jgi:hypothetical protein
MRTLILGLLLAMSHDATADTLGLIDNFSRERTTSELGTRWRLVTDQVMGGISDATMTRRDVDGRAALCLDGSVRLENNGGFVQMTLDLSPDGLLDATRYDGIRLLVRGDGAHYNLHLKTSATNLPWQSYRAAFPTAPQWREERLPFASFKPHRLVPALDAARLKRLGVVAIGRAMRAQLCIAEIGFYRDS